MRKTKIIQLDRSHVKVFRELKDVLIRLSSNSKVHQTIDIIVVDILEAYRAILSRDWLAKLNGYFEIEWSHLWLPYKGQPNKIKVHQENYMKHNVTDLNDSNETVMLSKSTRGDSSSSNSPNNVSKKKFLGIEFENITGSLGTFRSVIVCLM